MTNLLQLNLSQLIYNLIYAILPYCGFVGVVVLVLASILSVRINQVCNDRKENLKKETCYDIYVEQNKILNDWWEHGEFKVFLLLGFGLGLIIFTGPFSAML